jgi:hypothetical protein
MSGPERTAGIAIMSKIPVTFSRGIVAPAIPVYIPLPADDFRKEIARLRNTARKKAVTPRFRFRSKHGMWRFFLSCLLPGAAGAATSRSRHAGLREA